MTRLWRVGLAGLGSVGIGLAGLIAARPAYPPAGGEVRLSGVSARDRTRRRERDVSHLPWFDDPVDLAVSPTNDIFVELIGGSEGPARAAVEAALEIGKPVVTANKALIALHGARLATIAERSGAPLLFEAAVMGGTPAVKLIRECLCGDEIAAISGVLNGTCNFILSRMEAAGVAFADALGEARALGYAEADPSFDVGGRDAAHKIVILAALAFGRAPSFAATAIEGIAAVDPLDIRLAGLMGYRLRLLAQAARAGEGVTTRVGPTLLPRAHPLAVVEGVTNALAIEARWSGRIVLEGAGAGGGATAAAVAADIADVIAGARRPVFQAPASRLRGWGPDGLEAAAARPAERLYVRLRVRDESGVIAAVSEVLAHEGVSIEALLQRPVDGVEGVPVAMTTHPAAPERLASALDRLAALAPLLEPPRAYPIASP